MASVGHTSIHNPHEMQAASTTAGRFGARSNALVGHVTRQAPQAVQEASIRTVPMGSTLAT